MCTSKAKQEIHSLLHIVRKMLSHFWKTALCNVLKGIFEDKHHLRKHPPCRPPLPSFIGWARARTVWDIPQVSCPGCVPFQILSTPSLLLVLKWCGTKKPSLCQHGSAITKTSLCFQQFSTQTQNQLLGRKLTSSQPQAVQQERQREWISALLHSAEFNTKSETQSLEPLQIIIRRGKTTWDHSRSSEQEEVGGGSTWGFLEISSKRLTLKGTNFHGIFCEDKLFLWS